MKTYVPHFNDLFIDYRNETRWIPVLLLEEYHLLSANLTETVTDNIQGDHIVVLFHGEQVQLDHVIATTLDKINLIYRRSLRTVSHGWIQYWLTDQLKKDLMEEMIKNHYSVVDHLNFLTELIVKEVLDTSVVDNLQSTATRHKQVIEQFHNAMAEENKVRFLASSAHLPLSNNFLYQ